MSKKPISLALTLVGASGLVWIAACSSKTTDTGSSSNTASNNSSNGNSSNNSGTTDTNSTGSNSTSSNGTTGGGDSGSGNPTLLIDDETAATGTQLNAGSALRALIPSSGKVGTWYSYGWNAAAGAAITPPQGSFTFTAQTSGMFTKAACVSSTGYVGYSAGEGLNFATENVDSAMPPIVALDLSSFTGITFWAMSSSMTTVRVKFLDDQTDGSDPTAACNVDAAGGQCDDSFSEDEPVSTGWTQITVAFSDLIQHGFGATFAGLDKQNVRQLQFEDEGSGLADGGAPAFSYCIGPVSFTQ